VVIGQGLVDPQHLTVTSDRTLHVGDWGNINQVKAFSPGGKLLRAIGRPGGIQLGHYDEQRMHRPKGIAVDEKTVRLWVAEADWMPKRVSLWNAADGSFIKALYGPPKYGGGGTIDPEDRTRCFYDNYGDVILFKLDWARGESKPASIVVRRGLMGAKEDLRRWPRAVGTRPIHLGGRTYLVGTYSPGDGRDNGNAATFLFDEKTGIAWPAAFVSTMRWWYGDGGEKITPDVFAAMPKGRCYPVVTWSDRSFDHRVQTEEFSFFAPELPYTNDKGEPRRMDVRDAVQVLPDLGMVLGLGVRLPAPRIDEHGVALYDLDRSTFLVEPTEEFLRAADRAEGNWKGRLTRDGIIVWSSEVQDQGFQGLDRQGRPMWSYPGRRMFQGAPRQGGEVVEATRSLGPYATATKGEAGEWFAMNGEKENMYLMTTDGLSVQTLGGDMRTCPLLRYPEAKRGMLIDSPEAHVSFEDEHFGPTMTQTKDGEIHLVAGKEFGAIFRIEGFETIKRRDFRQDRADRRGARVAPTGAGDRRPQARPGHAVGEHPKRDAESGWEAG
jgi:hypothetical protein